jgi:hypothetical protein
VLENISSYLDMYMYNIQIISHTQPVHQFEGKVVLDSKLDSKSDSEILN